MNFKTIQRTGAENITNGNPKVIYLAKLIWYPASFDRIDIAIPFGGVPMGVPNTSHRRRISYSKNSRFSVI
jgi:hypothetical protein